MAFPRFLRHHFVRPSLGLDSFDVGLLQHPAGRSAWLMKQLPMLHLMCAAHLLVEIFVEAVKKERHQLLGVLLRESAELRRELAHDLLEARGRDDLGAQEKDGK